MSLRREIDFLLTSAGCLICVWEAWRINTNTPLDIGDKILVSLSLMLSLTLIVCSWVDEKRKERKP